MKLFERHDIDTTREQLPELPPDVRIPDDISGIVPPTTTVRPETGGVRWMRWLAVFALLAVAGLLIGLRNNGTDTPDDLMQYYGTDNPALVDGADGPHTVAIVGTEDLLALYGTDNPALVPEPTFMELYGTDNPTFVVVPGTAETGEFLHLYGTDNPVFLTEQTLMDLYGTDNPTFVIEQPEPVDTSEWLHLYGTDNPTFVD
jgi:hypothetical protein